MRAGSGRTVYRVALCGSLCCLAACSGPQSMFFHLGPESVRIATLFWIMLWGGTAIVLLVLWLTLAALYGGESVKAALSDRRVVIAGGIVFPTATLTLLLVYGFRFLESSAPAMGGGDPLRIAVVGARWWWRVTYLHADGTRTETANELRIPIDRPIEIELTSADVIHSFWVPAYAGKVDMVPGRKNVLRFVADTPGIARGQCAEYCGGAHALMSFYVVALEPADFATWMTKERAAARAASSEGQALFIASGCGGCHQIRGTSARGTIGPDLTHVGGRLSIGAGLLGTDAASLARWIRAHQEIKPENLMPPFAIFTAEESRLLSEYLASLE